MAKTPYAERLIEDVDAVLAGYGLAPDVLGIVIRLPRQECEAIAKQHPGHHPEPVLLRAKTGCVQIMLTRMPEDFPPGAITYLPPDE